MLRPFILTLAMLTPAVLSNFATADESDAAKKVDTNPSGTWHWTQDFGAGEAELWLVMNAKRNNLKGTLMMDGLDEPAEITDGKYEDGKFSFKLTVPVDGNDISSSVAGQVADNKLSAISTIDIDGDEQEFDIEAKRKTRVQDLAGTWEMEADVDGEFYDPVWVIEADGDKLTGVFKMFDQQVDFESIELRDNVVVLKTNVPLAGGMDLTLTCVPKGNKMTGEMIFEGDEAEGKADVMGSRVPQEKK
jgi:hypothetical protein